MGIKVCKECHGQLREDGSHYQLTSCVQREIDFLKAQLAAYERIAIRGVYYTLDELKQHDREVEMRIVQKLKKMIDESRPFGDPKYTEGVFNELWHELQRREIG